MSLPTTHTDIEVAADAADAPGLLTAALAAALVGSPALPVFACIGTDRSTGDALGPLVGERLLRVGCPPELVLGTLEHPLHALNLEERLRPLLTARPRRPVVAIDAALGPRARVGRIGIRRGGLHPGKGIGKTMGPVGDIAVTATVNVATGALDAEVLQSTRLYFVRGLADVIAEACWAALGVPVAPATAPTGAVAA
jgi:putative sporulation protein YyaC